MRLEVVTYCKDCDNRGDPIKCPMCWETYVEYEYCDMPESDYILHDQTEDDNYCKYGVKKEKTE